MKTKPTNSRRQFLNTVALGAAAGSIGILSAPLNASVPAITTEEMGDADKWFEKVKGSHRIVYDASTPHDGFAIIWTWAFYYSNNQTNTPDQDMTAVCVLRHNAIPFALKTELWEKYKLGEIFNVNDSKTGQASLRNLYYEPQTGDFPLPVVQGIKDMQGRGAMFCVCNLALSVYSSVVAAKLGVNAEEMHKEWVDAVYPDIQVVPSGVWALGRAQEKGCGYIFAGN